MKKVLLVLSFLLISFLSFADTVAQTEKFTVDFLNDFTYEEYQIPTQDGATVPLMIYIAETEKITTSLTSAPIAPEVFAQYDTNSILENSINNGIAQANGQLVEIKDIKLGNFFGKEGKYTVTQGIYVYKCYLRAYIIDKEIYVLGTASLQDDSESVLKFFNSFKLLKK